MEDFDTLKAQKGAIERRQFEANAYRVIAYIEEFALGAVSISRLGELLGVSPPVLRSVIVRAGKLMGGQAERDALRGEVEFLSKNRAENVTLRLDIAAVKKQRDEERERCAKIAEAEGCGEWSCGVNIAQKIRAEQK